jgi:hypothetical protein
MVPLMTHQITSEYIAENLTDVYPYPPEIGQVLMIDGARYLITDFDRETLIYTTEKEPRSWQGIVLWRPICTCGYRSSLGTRHRAHAMDAAHRHHIRGHVLTQPPGVVPTEFMMTHTWGIEPYWHD